MHNRHICRTSRENPGQNHGSDGSFGGSQFVRSNPKVSGPLESKMPIHLVLRARRSGMRSPHTFKTVNDIFNKTAKKHGVRIYEYANVGSHLHAVIKIAHVRRWAAFIRELSRHIAPQMKRKGFAGDAPFWLHRPYTRIVRGWKQAFKTAKEYAHLNFLEAEGFISRKDFKTLKDLRALWSD